MPQMWISIVIAYLLISLLLFVVGRISPYERSRNNENLTLESSFWFVLSGFLMRSATSVQPNVRFVVISVTRWLDYV